MKQIVGPTTSGRRTSSHSDARQRTLLLDRANWTAADTHQGTGGHHLQRSATTFPRLQQSSAVTKNHAGHTHKIFSAPAGTAPILKDGGVSAIYRFQRFRTTEDGRQATIAAEGNTKMSTTKSPTSSAHPGNPVYRRGCCHGGEQACERLVILGLL
jgi:hypothetical protein